MAGKGNTNGTAAVLEADDPLTVPAKGDSRLHCSGEVRSRNTDGWHGCATAWTIPGRWASRPAYAAAGS